MALWEAGDSDGDLGVDLFADHASVAAPVDLSALGLDQGPSALDRALSPSSFFSLDANGRSPSRLQNAGCTSMAAEDLEIPRTPQDGPHLSCLSTLIALRQGSDCSALDRDRDPPVRIKGRELAARDIRHEIPEPIHMKDDPLKSPFPFFPRHRQGEAGVGVRAAVEGGVGDADRWHVIAVNGGA